MSSKTDTSMVLAKTPRDVLARNFPEEFSALKKGASVVSALPDHQSLLTNHQSLPLRIRERHRIQQKLLVFLPMFIRPFLTGIFPGQFPALFSFNPLVLPDFLFDQVSDPVKRIGQHHWRHLHVLFCVEYLAHG